MKLFLQRQKETNEAQNLQISKLQIIERPNFAEKPFAPKPKKTVIAFISSVVLFYSLIFYREMNFSIIKTPEALDHLNIPQIGILPKVLDIKKGYHILQNFIADSGLIFSEAVRSSRTIIGLNLKKIKVF